MGVKNIFQIKMNNPFSFFVLWHFVLLLFPNEVLAAKGRAAKSVNQNADLNDIAKVFTIETAIKFSDGGHVMMLDDLTLGVNEYKKYQKVIIEDVLRDANGIKGVKFEPYTPADGMDFAAQVKATGRLHFTEGVGEILIQNVKGGELERVKFGTDEAGKIPIKAGHRMTVRELVGKLQKIDWRWSILHGYANQSKHLFEVGFSGHFTLILSERIKANGDGNDQLKEAVRFHFTPIGLRIFRKPIGDFVIAEDLSEIGQPSSAITNAEGRRGVYEKFEFPQSLQTRKLSITILKQIGLNIVGRRPFHNETFDCRAWGYLFILSIVPKMRIKELKDLANWPVNVQLEEEQFELMGVPSMFNKYVPEFDYKKWVAKPLKVWSVETLESGMPIDWDE